MWVRVKGSREDRKDRKLEEWKDVDGSMDLNIDNK